MCSRGKAMSWCLSVRLAKSRVANKCLRTSYSMQVNEHRDISVSDTSEGGSFAGVLPIVGFLASTRSKSHMVV